MSCRDTREEDGGTTAMVHGCLKGMVKVGQYGRF